MSLYAATIFVSAFLLFLVYKSSNSPTPGLLSVVAV
jgi:hypothetical protein